MLAIPALADALLIFKPDSAHRLAARAGIWGWLASERDWKVESLEWFQPPASLIESHYDFLQGRPFFPWLVDFMTALPVIVGRVTAADQALGLMRYDLGETQISKSRPGSLRERYGIFGGLNCLHLSDAADTGAAEVKRWSELVQLDQVKVDLDTHSEKPDHTFHLRSLATQVAGGIHTGSASDMIRQLLSEESDLDGHELEALWRITLGALS
jgi:nucleoside diphosphate kinase